MTELKLRLQIEGNADKTIVVDRDEFTIGRLPECNLQLPFSGISRYHARLIKRQGQWFVEDMGSKNGTALNEVSVTLPMKISIGDVIRLDNICLNVILSTGITRPSGDSDLLSEGMTLIGKAQDFQQQWIEADTQLENLNQYRKSIARLKDLVEIAKSLNSAESIEAIFSQVEKAVFRELKIIERLALLIDVKGTDELELIKAATRNPLAQQSLPPDGSWISRSICQKVFTEQVALKTADAQTDQRFEGELTIVSKGIRSALAVPLWDEGKVVGVLYGDASFSFHNWQQGGDEDLSFFSALANLVGASVQRWLLAQKLRSEETIRQRLERYHSPSIVQQLMNEGALSEGRLVSKESDISILFADIVGFTALSERLSPVQIADLLNAFFEEMLQEVFAVGGTLDKFIGDCIMAFFGAPEPQPDHAERAVTAAIRMLGRLKMLNAQGKLAEPLQLRVSINSGKAVVGDVGSSQRVDYTVLGATINLAARMEPICPPGHCVISEVTYELLPSPEQFQLMGEYRFKGIERPIRVYQTI